MRGKDLEGTLGGKVTIEYSMYATTVTVKDAAKEKEAAK